MWIVASTSLAPVGLMIAQVFCQAGCSALRSSSLNGRFSAWICRSILSGGSPLGRSGPSSFWTRPLPVMICLAVPPAHVLEHPEVGVELEPAGQVADRVGQVGPGDLAPGVEVEIGVDDQVPLGLGPRPDHRLAEDADRGLHRAAGMEPVDDLAHVGRQRGHERGVDRHRLGLDVQPDHRVGAGVVDRPGQARGLLADQAVQVHAEPLVLQREPAAQVLERIGEVAIDGRHVAADDRRPDAHRAALALAAPGEA